LKGATIATARSQCGIEGDIYEVSVGVSTDWGGCWSYPRIVHGPRNNRAKHLDDACCSDLWLQHRLRLYHFLFVWNIYVALKVFKTNS